MKKFVCGLCNLKISDSDIYWMNPYYNYNGLDRIERVEAYCGSHYTIKMSFKNDVIDTSSIQEITNIHQYTIVYNNNRHNIAIYDKNTFYLEMEDIHNSGPLSENWDLEEPVWLKNLQEIENWLLLN